MLPVFVSVAAAPACTPLPPPEMLPLLTTVPPCWRSTPELAALVAVMIPALLTLMVLPTSLHANRAAGDMRAGGVGDGPSVIDRHARFGGAGYATGVGYGERGVAASTP